MNECEMYYEKCELRSEWKKWICWSCGVENDDGSEKWDVKKLLSRSKKKRGKNHDRVENVGIKWKMEHQKSLILKQSRKWRIKEQSWIWNSLIFNTKPFFLIIFNVKSQRVSQGKNLVIIIISSDVVITFPLACIYFCKITVKLRAPSSFAIVVVVEIITE